MSLADLQRRVRLAVVSPEGGTADVALVGGGNPHARLQIHRRHYEASLVTALRSRFRATEWLIGSRPLVEAARRFVRDRPPLAPCIAEYGAEFPAWLADTPIAGRAPFLGDFARLDWELGSVSVAIDRRPATVDVTLGLSADALGDLTLSLQPGLFYLRSAWPIDRIMTLFLTDAEPDADPLAPDEIRLEIRGARGSFQFVCLSEAELRFRSAIQRGRTLGEAAAWALDADGQFNPGQALLALFAAGLPIAAASAPGDVQ